MEDNIQLIKSLVAFHSELTPLYKNQSVQVRTKKGYVYFFKYADLTEINKLINPLLTKNGLSIYHSTALPTQNSNHVCVHTALLHISGGLLETYLQLPIIESSPQAIGSLLTYARRYNIVNLLNLDASDDDDGNEGAGNEILPPKTTLTPKTPLTPKKPNSKVILAKKLKKHAETHNPTETAAFFNELSHEEKNILGENFETARNEYVKLSRNNKSSNIVDTGENKNG